MKTAQIHAEVIGQRLRTAPAWRDLQCVDVEPATDIPRGIAGATKELLPPSNGDSEDDDIDHPDP